MCYGESVQRETEERRMRGKGLEVGGEGKEKANVRLTVKSQRYIDPQEIAEGDDPSSGVPVLKPEPVGMWCYQHFLLYSELYGCLLLLEKVCKYLVIISILTCRSTKKKKNP